MSNPFFDHPILNSPYEIPKRHWELDEQGQPTQKLIETRRRAEFITPIPKPKKRSRCLKVHESIDRIPSQINAQPREPTCALSSFKDALSALGQGRFVQTTRG